MRCLITGGLGFIGSNLALHALGQGAEVTVLDNLLHGCGGRSDHLQPTDGRLRIVVGDARNRRLMDDLVDGMDVVFSLAGKVSHSESMTAPEEDLEHNTRAPLVTLEAVRQVQPTARVVFASTRQVYGVPRYLPVDEQHPVQPVDVNGVNKLSAEQYHTLYARVYGSATVCLRLTNTYGPRQLIRHNRQGFTGWFVRLALEDRPITLYGEGSQRRDFCFVHDAVEALWLAGVREVPPGVVLNVPGGEVATLAAFARLAAELGGGGRVEFVPFPEEQRRIDIGDYVTNGARIQSLLDWRPRVSLADGLRQTFLYYRERASAYLSPP